MILQWEEFCVNSRTKAAHFLELLCFFPFFFFFFFFFFLFLEGKEGCAARFISFFLETIQKILGSVHCFLANSLFLSFTRFLWVRTSSFGQVIISSFVLLKFLTFWSGISLAPFASLSRKLREHVSDEVFNIATCIIYLIIFNKFIY